MLIITLLLLDLLKENAYAADVSVYCPENGFTDNMDTNLTGSFNSSVLSTGKCAFGVSIVKFVFTKGTSKPVALCSLSFSTSTCNTTFTTQNCKCDNVTGEMFYYTYFFTVNASVHEGGVMELTTDCEVRAGDEPLTVETCTLTITKTTTPTIPTPTSIPNCENCNCTGKCICPDKCSQIDKCPVWCIVVSVCVPCAFLGIILITVIIIKKKKAKAPGNSEGGRNGTKLAVQDTKEMQDKTKHHGTENRPKNAQGGSNQAEESVQDTKEMQDKTKHLGTENSADL